MVDPIHPSFKNYMITCHVRYVIDANLIPEFETYAKMWIPLVVNPSAPGKDSTGPMLASLPRKNSAVVSAKLHYECRVL